MIAHIVMKTQWCFLGTYKASMDTFTIRSFHSKLSKLRPSPSSHTVMWPARRAGTNFSHGIKSLPYKIKDKIFAKVVTMDQ